MFSQPKLGNCKSEVDATCGITGKVSFLDLQLFEESGGFLLNLEGSVFNAIFEVSNDGEQVDAEPVCGMPIKIKPKVLVNGVPYVES